MAILINGSLISLAADDGDYCGNGVMEEFLLFLRRHGGGGGGGGGGDPIGPVELPREVQSELTKLGRQLIETAERFEHVAARAAREKTAV